MTELGQKMLSKKLYLAPGVKQLAWYLTPGYWGIAISEAEKAEDITHNINLRRIAKPDIFKSVKVERALETVQLIPQVLKLSRKVKE